MTYYIAQAISILVAGISVVALQMKTMKKLLIGQILINGLAAFSYLLIKGYSAAAIGIIAVLQCCIMYYYNKQNQKPPLWVVGIFIALYISCSAVFYQGLTDILPGFAAVLFAISVACKRPVVARTWSMINAITWITYDCFMSAWGGLIMHMVILSSVLIAFVRVDHIFQKKSSK